MKALNELELRSTFITLLRAAVGWHFLYEGYSKLIQPNWSSGSFLAGSNSFISGFYHWLASSDQIVQAVDFLNILGLIGIGLALFFGVFIRFAAISGVLLLALYYFAYPPFGASNIMQPEGHLYIVNKIFIEAMVLMVIALLKDTGYGIQPFINHLKHTRISQNNPGVEKSDTNNRREAIKNLATVPLFGLMGWGAIQKTRELRELDADTMSGATIKIGSIDISELKGELPRGKIGKHEISRLVAGGNLIGGWAHARDLIYVPSLFRAYNTEKKVFETLILAEKAGINTINIGFPSNALMQKYKKLTGSKIQVISQVAPNLENGDFYEQINQAIDFGVDIIQVQGNFCDWLVRDDRIDVIEKMISKIRTQGYTAGLASHTVDALIACEEYGIIPDYYMKTMHHDQYWSAHPRENRVPFEVDGKNYLDHNKFHNNIFCLYPDRTIEFVNRAKVPVMGFKVLAAGAIEPEDGFNWAFENGADFICVGMFDFQVVKNVNIAINTLNNLPNRKREWYG